jgi:light-regulated signal transduction histidine kinase (bacteriophytochrome)
MLNLAMKRYGCHARRARPAQPYDHNPQGRGLRHCRGENIGFRRRYSQKDLARIFDAFVTTKPHGTGLGLPIARTIIESYGGEVWAENRNRGAVISFRLPLVKVT